MTPGKSSARTHRAPRAFQPPPGGFPSPATSPQEDETAPRRHLPRKRQGIRWGRILWASLGGLLVMGLGLAASRLVEDLFARQDWLGWMAVGLSTAAVLAALAIIVREVWALSRLGRIGAIREIAERALRHDAKEDAADTLLRLHALYAGRRDMALALSELTRHEREVIDAGDRVRLAERTLMRELDEEAFRLIAQSSRRVSIATALMPAATLDVLMVAVQNLMMLRQLATLYGGRPGSLGTLKLARMVVTHLAVTGGVALSDTLVQNLIGRGLAGRLSARIGEGAVNGIMTARIGLAALDLVRPLPFATLPKPRLSAIAGRIAETNGPADETSP